MNLIGAIYAVVDLAFSYSKEFHIWCKAKCPIYGFSNDFKGHLIAVRAIECALFWEGAVADPASMFPTLVAFTKQKHERRWLTLMTDEKKKEITASMKAAVKAGQQKNNDWMFPQCVSTCHTSSPSCTLFFITFFSIFLSYHFRSLLLSFFVYIFSTRAGIRAHPSSLAPRVTSCIVVSRRV